jgi:hypothetical protein
MLESEWREAVHQVEAVRPAMFEGFLRASALREGLSCDVRPARAAFYGRLSLTCRRAVIDAPNKIIGVSTRKTSVSM